MKKEDGCLPIIRWICGVLILIFSFAFLIAFNISSPSIAGIFIPLCFLVTSIFIIPGGANFADQVFKGQLTFIQVIKKLACPIFVIVFAILLTIIINISGGNRDNKDITKEPETSTKDNNDAPMVFRT